MKLSVFLMLIGMMQVSANVYSQAGKINVQVNQVTLSDLLWELQENSDIVFVYKTKDLVDLPKVSIDKKDASVTEILDELLLDTNLEYTLDHDVVIIKKKLPKPIEVNIELSEKQKKNELKGTVTDEDGNTLPGVSVIIKGTVKGVSTDIDGNYKIQFEEESAILVFSFVGMNPKEVAFKGQTSIDVVLQADTEALGEVVVTGYTKISKERATGAFVKIDTEELAKRPTLSVNDMLVGSVSGVSKANGKIQIRGRSTLLGDGQDEPLYVVDGFPSTSIDMINPKDIESITVLKDAAAASIWGAKASNGVIVITTKKGQKNKPLEVNFSGHLAIQEKYDIHDMKYRLSASESIDRKVQMLKNGVPDINELVSNNYALTALDEAWAYREGLATNGVVWTEEQFNTHIEKLKKRDAKSQFEKHLLRSKLEQTYHLSASGGGEKNTFYGSLSFTDTDFAEVGHDKNSFKINLNNIYNVTDKLDFSINLGLSRDVYDQNNPKSVDDLVKIASYNTLYDENGDLNRIYDYCNPWLSKEMENTEGYLPFGSNLLEDQRNMDVTTVANRINSIFKLDYEIIKGLKLSSSYNFNFSTINKDDYQNENISSHRTLINQTYREIDSEMVYQIPRGSRYHYEKINSKSFDWRNTISFDKIIDKHQINFFAGFELRKVFSEYIKDYKYGFDKETTSYTVIDSKAAQSGFVSWQPGVDRIQIPWFNYENSDTREVSMFSNIAYTYDDKYTLTGSYRVDQKNLYGSDPKFRYKPLWSIGSSWQMGKEDFIKDIEWINRLTLRATYGISGNSSIESPYPSAIFDVSSYTGKSFKFLKLKSAGNPRLKWEETATTNIAVDYAVLNSRIRGSVELYHKNSTDLIGKRTINPTYGFVSNQVNYASMTNSGIDFSIKALVINKKDLKLDLGLNISRNINEITNITKDNSAIYEVLRGEYLVKGKPLGLVYSYNYAGLNDIGEAMLYDTDGNKKNYTEGVNDYDELVYHGPRVAPTYGGFNANLEYKDFSLGINGSFRYGNYFLNIPPYDDHTSYRNRWKKPGDEKHTNVPGISRNGINPETGIFEDTYKGSQMRNLWNRSQYRVDKAGYLKIDDLVLGYNVNSSLLEKLNIKRAKLSLQVSNVFNKYNNRWGVNPDDYINTFKNNTKTFIFGINLTI